MLPKRVFLFTSIPLLLPPPRSLPPISLSLSISLSFFLSLSLSLSLFSICISLSLSIRLFSLYISPLSSLSIYLSRSCFRSLFLSWERMAHHHQQTVPNVVTMPASPYALQGSFLTIWALLLHSCPEFPLRYAENNIFMNPLPRSFFRARLRRPAQWGGGLPRESVGGRKARYLPRKFVPSLRSSGETNFVCGMSRECRRDVPDCKIVHKGCKIGSYTVDSCHEGKTEVEFHQGYLNGFSKAFPLPRRWIYSSPTQATGIGDHFTGCIVLKISSLGNYTESHHSSGVSVVCANDHGFLWNVPKVPSEFAWMFDIPKTMHPVKKSSKE